MELEIDFDEDCNNEDVRKSVYNTETKAEISGEDLEAEFWVQSPQDSGSYVTYETRGIDNQGIWECRRRYSEFFVLRDVLCKRFPGIPVPRIPPK